MVTLFMSFFIIANLVIISNFFSEYGIYMMRIPKNFLSSSHFLFLFCFHICSSLPYILLLLCLCLVLFFILLSNFLLFFSLATSCCFSFYFNLLFSFYFNSFFYFLLLVRYFPFVSGLANSKRFQVLAKRNLFFLINHQ